MTDPRFSATRNGNLVERYLRLDPVERRHAFLTTRDASRRVGVAQRTLQTWIMEGKIDAVRVGGRYLVDSSSLDSFIRHAVDE